MRIIGYGARPGVACCSVTCTDRYTLEEFLFDVDWLNPLPRRPRPYTRVKVLPQRRQVYYFVRTCQALLRLYYVKSMLRSEYLTEPRVFTAPEKRLAMAKRVLKVWSAPDVETVKKSFAKALPHEFEM
jgi:hypothetical protein